MGNHAGKVLNTNQYSVTEYDSPATTGDLQLPSVWFLYDLSPVTVTIAQTRRSILHLLTRFCAVVGGVFAVTGGHHAQGFVQHMPRCTCSSSMQSFMSVKHLSSQMLLCMGTLVQ